MLSYEGAAAAKEDNFRNQDTGGRRSIHLRGLASLRMAMQNPSQRLSVSEDGSASCVDGVQFRRVGTVQIYTRKESKKFRVYIQHTTFLIGKEIRQTKSVRWLSEHREGKGWKSNEGKQIIKKQY